jgi:hypothetical protein
MRAPLRKTVVEPASAPTGSLSTAPFRVGHGYDIHRLQTGGKLILGGVQVSDQITFGPELQIAKQLIDECMTEWSADSRPEIQSIVTRAFNTDKEGQVNRSEVFMLQKLDFKDERWLKAMEAISDAIRVTGSKEYVRFHRRDRQQDEWQPVTIDMAKA